MILAVHKAVVLAVEIMGMLRTVDLVHMFPACHPLRDAHVSPPAS